MKYVKQFVLFCWDFVVGDDWRLAGGAVAGIALTFLLAHLGRNAWWLLPVLIIAALALSVGMVARRSRPRPSQAQAADATRQSRQHHG